MVLMDNERRVTALKVQKRNPNRVNIYLDGEYAFGLARIVAAWLQVGQTLSDEKIILLQRQDTEEVIYLKAMRYLGNRPHSEAEIQKKLTLKGYEESDVQKIVGRLREQGYLGDIQFARNWIENRTAFRPRGRRLLALELRQKGVSEEVILEALQNTDNESELAFSVARRYARRLAELDKNKFREKLTSYLGRRGFTYEVASPVVRQVWAEQESLQAYPTHLENGED